MDRHYNGDHPLIVFSASAVEHDLRRDPNPPLSNKAQTVGLLIRLLRFRNIFVMLIVGVLVVSCSGDSREEPLRRVGVAVPAVDLTNAVHTDTRELLEQQIGVERTGRVAELITDHVDSIYPYVKYRTYAAEFAEKERRSRELYDQSDDERHHARFGILVRGALYDANDTRNGDIALGSGRMHDAYIAGLEECAGDFGITNIDDMMRPSVEDLPIGLTEEFDDYDEEYDENYNRMAEEVRRWTGEYDQFAESLGFTRDELLDLRHSCSRYAATLPSLDPDVREHLFRLLHEHYLSAVRAWLAENPQATEPPLPAFE